MQSQASSSSAGGKPERLYIGNLAPTVDEYTLIQVLQKYGKITKLDFIFHKTGPSKGKPRGYAFIEFGHKDEALKAMSKLHGRLLRGRNLVVTYANSAPSTDNMPLANKSRRPDPSKKTTTLSLLKTSKKPQSASAQIAAMEAKLASLASRKPADEDYVPGQRYGTSLGTASPAPDVFTPGSASPARHDEAMGQEAAAIAAADLEKEFMAEIAPTTESAQEAERSMRDELRDGLGETSTQCTPPQAGTGATAAPTPMSEAFKRGLATLPPRPMT